MNVSINVFIKSFNDKTPYHTTIILHLRPIIVRHASHLLTFNGTIRMDEQSNRFLNLTILVKFV